MDLVTWREFAARMVRARASCRHRTRTVAIAGNSSSDSGGGAERELTTFYLGGTAFARCLGAYAARARSVRARPVGAFARPSLPTFASVLAAQVAPWFNLGRAKGSWRPAQIAEKLSASLFQWAACARALSSRCAPARSDTRASFCGKKCALRRFRVPVCTMPMACRRCILIYLNGVDYRCIRVIA